MTKTMTLNLSDREMAVVEALAVRAELSKTQVIRQALKLYQMVDQRLRDGESIHFSGDPARSAAFIGFLGLGEASHGD